MKVSIITPAYKTTDEQYAKTANSINAQTNKNFEWVVVADESVEFIYWADARLENNFGPSVARNVGFQISSGDIITYVDMGDELDPKRIQNVIDVFSAYPISLLFSAYSIHYNQDVTAKFDHFDYMERLKLEPYQYIQLLEKQNISIPMGVAHTRKPFVEVGGFQRGIVCGEDGILWRRMADTLSPMQIMFADGLAGTYNVNEKGQSRTQRRFDMGGFAFDAQDEAGSHGQSLDFNWFNTFNSEGLYDEPNAG